MYLISFYVPESHLDLVKQAMFAAGAGRVGRYDCCCWQTAGTGQYRPLPGSQPFHGTTNELAQVPEYKVELVCEDSCLKPALQALLASHPYETPAYSIIQTVSPFKKGGIRQ